MTPRRFPWILAAVIDLVLIATFAAVGITNHDGDVASELLRVAWPFVTGAAMGWLVSVAWKAPVAPVRAGVTVWFFTVGCGMILRVATGGGFDWAFLLVAALLLFAFLVGWRGIVAGTAWILAKARRPRT